MSQQGAVLRTYNNELVKCIEELMFKKDELNKQIQQEEEEKSGLQHDIRLLTEKLNRVSESLDCHLTSWKEVDQTIAETEAAYMKILESSETLLSVLKQETGNLAKAADTRSSKDRLSL